MWHQKALVSPLVFSSSKLKGRITAFAILPSQPGYKDLDFGVVNTGAILMYTSVLIRC